MFRYDGWKLEGTYLQKKGEHGLTMVIMPNGSIRRQVFKENDKKMDKWLKDVDGEKDKIVM